MFGIEILPECTRQIMKICENKVDKKVYRFKVVAILPIFLSRDSTIPQKWGQIEIWLKVADHQ